MSGRASWRGEEGSCPIIGRSMPPLERHGWGASKMAFLSTWFWFYMGVLALIYLLLLILQMFQLIRILVYRSSAKRGSTVVNPKWGWYGCKPCLYPENTFNYFIKFKISWTLANQNRTAPTSWDERTSTVYCINILDPIIYS